MGNCYFISGIVAFSDKNESFRKVFVVQEANTSGLLAFNVFIRGKPQIVTIDDTIAFLSAEGKVIPAFAQIGMDGALFGPLIEKLWAKINGSYEKTTAGW